MAIYDILSSIKDVRDNPDGICDFNGYLEDYLSFIENDTEAEKVIPILTRIFEMDHNVKVAAGLRLNINKDAIANQIIRYKDSFKLPSGTICCPYVIYGDMDGNQKGVIVTVGDKEAYIIAKALYYVISEPENEYEGTRNEIIAVSVDEENVDQMMNSVETFILQNKKAGIVQRDLDAQIFHGYEEMYELASEMAAIQKEQCIELLKANEDKETCINQLIATWFLLKKFSYVQYMMDKNNLNRVHEGNVKKQRQVAKEKCDAITFVSYSELWKMVKEL